MIRRILGTVAPSFHPTRWGPARQALLFLTSLLRPSTLSVRYGFRLYIPRQDRSIYTFSLWRDQVYEPEASELAWGLLQAGDTAVDIGANVGYCTCLYAKRVGPDGQVFAFEPETRNYKLLERNVDMNGFSCVIPQSQALSDEVGFARLHISEDNRGDHTLVQIAGREAIEVATDTFDAFARREIAASTIRLVKIDVQGFEIKVLRGMKESLAAGHVENVVLEFTPSRTALAGDDPAEVFDIIRSSGMKCKVISATESYRSLQAVQANIETISHRGFATFDLWLTRSV